MICNVWNIFVFTLGATPGVFIKNTNIYYQIDHTPKFPESSVLSQATYKKLEEVYDILQINLY